MDYFTSFGIKDFFDILGVALLLFYFYKLMKRTGSINMFVGIMLFIIVWMLVSQMLGMQLLGAVFDKLVDVGVIALIVLFADDIRQFFRSIGTHTRTHSLFKWLTKRGGASPDVQTWLPVAQACMSMGAKKQGALIVIRKEQSLEGIVQGGESVNANLNQMLIENIFFKNSPLHDGAMIIDGGRIASAACILPISHTEELPKSFGLRHRAAMGLTEETDAVAVVVSEETGYVSVFHSGNYRINLNQAELLQFLSDPDKI